MPRRPLLSVPLAALLLLPGFAGAEAVVLPVLLSGEAPVSAPPAGGAAALAPSAGLVRLEGGAGSPVRPLPFELLPATIDTGSRTAPVLTPHGPPLALPRGPRAIETWYVGDVSPGLYINNQPAAGPNYGIANRFDPADSWDTATIPPRPFRITKIFFWVNGAGEPTGPMEWHIWEDNGGHKADEARDIVPPFTVTGAPGQNTIDLVASGIDVLIDPPRMIEVGVANKASNTNSPDILLDDGLPYPGDTGDFHASLTYNDAYCGSQWGMLTTGDLGDTLGSRGPVWMIWLEVDWLAPPAQVWFDETAAGDFAGASRVAVGDYDNDGFEDILADGSRLYRNNGDGTFSEVTAAAGITDGGNGGLWGDYDNDGDLDFYQYTPNCVPCGQADNPDDLWRNNGDGTFTNVRNADYGGDPAAPVPHDPLPTEGAAWGDFNGDGWLDLYAGNHVDWASGDCYDDYLWLNGGPPDFAFADVSVISGVRGSLQCSRGVAPADFDADGDLDIFVSTYRLNPDLLWVNQGNDPGSGIPQFTEEAQARGVQGVQTSGAYGHGIGAQWADFDNDADLDLVVGNLAHSAWRCFSNQTMVYESSGAGGNYTFADRRAAAGVEYNEVHSEASLADFDNDGWLDLHITQVYDGWRDALYRNLGTVPATFENVTPTSGMWPRNGWGSAWFDYDRDGDVDLIARKLWKNRSNLDRPGNEWIQVEAVGCGSNRRATGASMRVHPTPVSPYQFREVSGGRGTGSQDSSVQHFGLGPGLGTVEEIRVRFPSGQVQVLNFVPTNQRITVREVGAYIRPVSAASCPGQPVDFEADTCGAAGLAIDWDLDDDGQFDDATGPTATANFPGAGTHAVSVQVSDGTTSSVTRLEYDVTAPSPSVTCPAVVNATPTEPGAADVALVATASDPCDPAPVVTNSRTPNGADASDLYPCGDTYVLFTATNTYSQTATCSSRVTVADTAPPAEVSGAGSLVPLRVRRAAGDPATLEILLEVLAEPGAAYNLYEGTIPGGGFPPSYDHVPVACKVQPLPAGPGEGLLAAPRGAPASRYYLVTATNCFAEGARGSGTPGPIPGLPTDCGPLP